TWPPRSLAGDSLLEFQISLTRRIERLEHVIHGPAQIRQQRLCCALICAETRNGSAVQTNNSEQVIADTELHPWNHIERTKCIATDKPQCTAEFDLMLAFDPVNSVAVLIERGYSPLWIVVHRNWRRHQTKDR